MARWLWTLCVCAIVACSGSSTHNHHTNSDPGAPDGSVVTGEDGSVRDGSVEEDASIPDASLPDGGWRCGFYGDEGEPPALVPLLWQFDGGFADLTSVDQPAPLWRAFQGGHVLLVGARIYNLYGCNAAVTARVRIPGDGGIAAEESRSVDFAFHSEDGGIPDLKFWNVANVPICPNYQDLTVFNIPWTLEVIVRDRSGRTATSTQEIVPSCAADTAQARFLCECECEPGYYFGKCQWPPQDAGP